MKIMKEGHVRSLGFPAAKMFGMGVDEAFNLERIDCGVRGGWTDTMNAGQNSVRRLVNGKGTTSPITTTIYPSS